jgi:thymidylate synthase (FAD)
MKNKVSLLGYYGSDEIIACSAWTSTSRDLSEDKKARIPKLINMLWRDGHHTPFEKSTLHFLVDTEIASHIHLLKSRIGVSINAESARYKELKEDKYYIPDDWIALDEVDEDGCSGNSHESISVYSWAGVLKEYTEEGNRLYHQCLKELEPILGRKRAKESARFFKTYNSQIQADISFNMRSFAHFQKLRNSEHAQKEIRELAQEMLDLVKNIDGNPFKYSLQALESSK